MKKSPVTGHKSQVKKINKIQKEIICFLQGDIPLKPNPYTGLAKKLDIAEDEIIRQIKVLKKQGYIRRFGAILSHHKVGLNSNCMCVWNVPKLKINKISKGAFGRPEISHCYLRKTTPDWPYNFYTMIHAGSPKQCMQIINELSKQNGVSDYKMLFTKKQFKKTSPVYKI
ncbi:MAG: Lrp/AsnC family transcriptional regulator [Candidatus Omnitrophota bacterium]